MNIETNNSKELKAIIATLIQDKERLLQEKQWLHEEKQNLQTEKQTLQREKQNLQEEKLILQFQLQKFQNQIFGKKSEKWSKDEESQSLLFNEIEIHHEITHEEKSPEIKGEVSLFTKVSSHTRKKPGRTAIPEHFPRTEHVIDLKPEEKVCKCGCELTRIGEETSEKVDIIPPKILVNKYIRPKYVCKRCKGGSLSELEKEVKIAQVPNQFLRKAIAEAGFVAYSLIAKFCDGLPFYRFSNIFHRYGFKISRGTLCNYAYEAFDRVKYLEKQMMELLLQSPVIQIDETPLLVLSMNGEKKTTKSYMFVIRGIVNGKVIVCFVYSPTRSAKCLEDFLSRYKGIVQTDGYTSYDSILKTKPGIIHAGCWVHVRREFMQILKLMPTHADCLIVVRLIRDFYVLESEMKGKSFLERKLIREKQTKPIIMEIKAWMDKALLTALPNSPFGKALAYMANQWPKLIHFLEHPDLPADTNLVENAIRPFVIGRKNWLFSATEDGARASAFFYSFIETTNANGKDSYQELKKLFIAVQEGERPDILSVLY